MVIINNINKREVILVANNKNGTTIEILKYYKKNE